MLIDFLKSRQHGFKEGISIEKNTIIFSEPCIKIDMTNWEFLAPEKYDDFISRYVFPANEDLSAKDRKGVRENFPEPNIILQQKTRKQTTAAPLIVMYLYHKTQLTGDSLLLIRSINKFEQMWTPYFMNLQKPSRSNPRRIKKDFFEYCQSGEMKFTYSLSNEESVQEAALRILTFSFNDLILLMYVFDTNEYPLSHQ
jgi:hypothetical protein